MSISYKPKLRFQEFSDDWRLTTLGKISDNIGYGLNAAACSFDGVNGYIRITDIDEDNRFSSGKKTSPSGELDENFLLEEGDIVFVRTGATTGKTYKYTKQDGKLFFAGFLIRFSIKSANTDFIFQQTLSEKYRKWVSVMSMRSGQPGINAQEVKSYSFYLPCQKEQQKIADFLSAVDEKIRLLKEKHALLQQYKKGVMQKLFSQEIRFKDENGQAFPEWRIEPLGKWFTEYNESSVEENQCEVLTSSRKGLIKQSEYYGEGRITERSNKGFNVIPNGYLTYRSRSDDRQFFFNLNDLGFTGIISTYYPVVELHPEVIH